MMTYRVKGMPWSTGVGTDVKDCTTAREVIEQAGLDWQVKKCDIVAKMPFGINYNNEINESDGDFSYNGNIYRNCYNAYATYRTDKNIPLGIVKKKYEVVQNMDAFNFFDDAIGYDKAQWESAGFFGNGQKIFVTAKLPDTIKVNNDPVESYLIFSNSHDGTSSVSILFAPVRVACTNMLNSAFESANSYIRIRHTQKAKERLEQGAEVLRIACEHARRTEDIYNALYAAKLSDEQVMAYIANLVLTDKERTELLNYDPKDGYKKLFNRNYITLETCDISTRKANQLSTMMDYYISGAGQDAIVGTAWGAYNAITGYYSNVANLDGEKRMDSLCYGGANRTMQRALVSAAELAEVV